MNKLPLFITVLLACLANEISAQLYLTVKPMTGSNTTYGVYMQPCDGLPLSGNTITGSGQITLVAPTGAIFMGITSVSGTWQAGDMIGGPSEAPNKVYYSTGFLMDYPAIAYTAGMETLLFTVQMGGFVVAQPELIDNENDPFAQLPNSYGTNPGNDLAVIDIGATPTSFYNYAGNYAPDAFGCGGEPQPGNPEDSPFYVGAVKQGERLGRKWFALVPNPAIDWVKVDFGGEEQDTQGLVRLWDASGNALGKLDKRQNPAVTINVWELPPGLYFITYESEGKVLQRERFMKN
jgi:type IX secretion system substrate protein